MVNYARDKGTLAETAAAKYLSTLTGLKVTRTPQYGKYDRGDLQGIPNLAIEIKNTKTLLLDKWLGELGNECVNAEAGYGVLLWSPPGFGPKSVAEWVAIEAPGLHLGRWERPNSLGFSGAMRRFSEVVHSTDGCVYRVDRKTGETTARARRVSRWADEMVRELVTLRV